MIPVELLVLIGILLGIVVAEEFLINPESNEDAQEDPLDTPDMSEVIKEYDECAEGIQELLETQKEE